MANSTSKRFKCLCCGYFTLDREANNTFQLCPVCYWEDDGVQLAQPDYTGGANAVSLNQARLNFKEFGVSDERFKLLVRRPLENEIKDSNLE